MRRVLISGLFALALLALSPAATRAADLSWSGALEISQDYQAFRIPVPPGLDEMSFGLDLRLKLEIDGGPKQSGLVVLDSSTLDPGAVDLRRAYLDLALPPHALLRLGRQKIAWGTGFAWNPTNYLGSDKNRADLTAESLGVDALNLETDRGKAAGVFLLKPAPAWADWGMAARLGWPGQGYDLSWSAFRQGPGRGLGGDLAITLGDWIIHAELAWKTDPRVYVAESGGIYQILERPEALYFHGVLGAYGNLRGGVFALLELYHNQAGWSEREAAAYWAAPPEVRADPRLQIDLFGDRHRNYLFCLVRQAGLGRLDDLEASVSLLWGLDDRGFVLTPEARYTLSQDVALTVTGNFFHGEPASEFGSLPTCGAISVALTMNF